MATAFYDAKMKDILSVYIQSAQIHLWVDDRAMNANKLHSNEELFCTYMILCVLYALVYGEDF